MDKTNKKAAALQSRNFLKKMEKNYSLLHKNSIPQKQEKFKNKYAIVNTQSFNIFDWCEQIINVLTANNVEFYNGFPLLKDEMIYKGQLINMVPEKYAYEVKEDERKNTVLCFYETDDRLFERVLNINKDIKKFKCYAGVVGFDISPSVFMLKERQELSILINCLYNCYLGVNGIKILPNARTGSLQTIYMLKHFSDNCDFAIGMHGCKKNGMRVMREYIYKQILKIKNPNRIYVYGSFSINDVKAIYQNKICQIIVFPSRNDSSRRGTKPYQYFYSEQGIAKEHYTPCVKGVV